MSWSLAELAARLAGEVRGDPETRVEDLRTLDLAGPHDLSFLTRSAYREQALGSRAGALLVPADFAAADRPLLMVADPAVALIDLLTLFRPPAAQPSPGIHTTAVIGHACEIDPSASIGPYAVIGDGSRIASGVVLHPHVVVGRRCVIGAGAILFPHVVLYEGTEIGSLVVIHAGAVLGADGFGYTTRRGEHLKVPQVGRAVIEDGVEIGANSAVDRAMLEETRIGAGSKIDNLVQVGHNVQIGRGCLLCGQAGIAGSTRLGDYVVMGGQSGAGSELGKHIELGNGAQVAGKSAVFQSVTTGQQVGGIPAVELRKWRRQVAATGGLPELLRRVRQLEKRLAAQAREEDEP